MIKNIRHIGIRVLDMDNMIAFYESLGFKLVSRCVENWEGIQLEVTKLKTQFGLLELIKTSANWPECHSAWTVKNFPEWLPIYEKGDSKYFKDPEGNYFELVKE